MAFAGFKFAGCPDCCEGPPNTCPTACSNYVPETISVTFASIANGTCSFCGDYNSTFIVPILSGCDGELDINCTSASCAAGARSDCCNTISWSFIPFAGNVIFRIIFYYGGQFGSSCAVNNRNYQINLGPAPVTCAGAGSKSLTLATSTDVDATQTCNFASATCTAVL